MRKWALVLLVLALVASATVVTADKESKAADVAEKQQALDGMDQAV